MKIAITGSSGFIGSHLASYLRERGHTLILFSRSERPGAHVWDPEAKKIDAALLEGTDVVVHLAGESILGRWNAEKMEEIRKSRLLSTQFLCETLLHLDNPPSLYIGASAIGYYGNREGEVLTETSPPGQGFLADLCREWEHIPACLNSKQIRVALARFGVVLGEEGGALKQMIKPFRMGLGGVLGSGKQIMSWIDLDDVLGGMEHIMNTPTLMGPVNFTSPNPVSNRQFTQTLAKLLKRPALFSMPKALLETLVGSAADELLASCHVLPARLIESGYAFRFPEIELALKNCLRLNS